MNHLFAPLREFVGSIGNRVFLILLAGILVATVTTTWLASNERRNTMRELRYQHVAERVEQVVQALDPLTPQARDVVLHAADNFGFEAGFVNEVGDMQSPSTGPMADMLKSRLGEDRQIVVQRETDCAPRRPRNAPPDGHDRAERPRMETCRVIYVSLRDKALLRLRLHMPGDPPSTPCRRASGARSSTAPTCWRRSRMICRRR